MAVATPPRPDHDPTAAARSAGRNTDSRIASEPGVSSAAPTPCSARMPMSRPETGATAHPIEATVNHTTPITNTRRRPSRSPSDPPSSSSPANANV